MSIKLAIPWKSRDCHYDGKTPLVTEVWSKPQPRKCWFDILLKLCPWQLGIDYAFVSNETLYYSIVPLILAEFFYKFFWFKWTQKSIPSLMCQLTIYFVDSFTIEGLFAMETIIATHLGATMLMLDEIQPSLCLPRLNAVQKLVFDCLLVST